ncbi:MAG TPA: hypothetical protein VG754_00625 [Verrucomicrobiae bacterium]|nr:hypothetical protein [Verrucomicrobiae bacterium]
MKRILFSTLAAMFLFATLALPVRAGDLESMTGKWSCIRTNENGLVCTQTLEIKKDKFTFRVTDSDNKLMLHARGDVKLGKSSELTIATFENIEAGRSDDEWNEVNDDRHCVYFLDGDSLTLGLNFDKDREKGPRIEVYTRAQK